MKGTSTTLSFKSSSESSANCRWKQKSVSNLWNLIRRVLFASVWFYIHAARSALRQTYLDHYSPCQHAEGKFFQRNLWTKVRAVIDNYTALQTRKLKHLSWILRGYSDHTLAFNSFFPIARCRIKTEMKYLEAHVRWFLNWNMICCQKRDSRSDFRFITDC